MKEAGPYLRDYLETRLNLLDERLKELDVRYEQRFQAQQQAISKSEVAMEERLKGMNEFRDTLTDQAATLMPRNESMAMIAVLSEKLNKLENRIDSSEGQALGSSDYHKESQSNVGVWISIVAVLISAVVLFLSFKK